MQKEFARLVLALAHFSMLYLISLHIGFIEANLITTQIPMISTPATIQNIVQFMVDDDIESSDGFNFDRGLFSRDWDS